VKIDPITQKTRKNTMIPARMVRTGGPSGGLELSPALLCFGLPVLGESVSDANRVFLGRLPGNLVAFSNHPEFLAKGSGCLQRETVRVILILMGVLPKSLKMSEQVASPIITVYSVRGDILCKYVLSQRTTASVTAQIFVNGMLSAAHEKGQLKLQADLLILS
jgi:hypothetical protein